MGRMVMGRMRGGAAAPLRQRTHGPPPLPRTTCSFGGCEDGTPPFPPLLTLVTNITASTGPWGVVPSVPDTSAGDPGHSGGQETRPPTRGRAWVPTSVPGPESKVSGLVTTILWYPRGPSQAPGVGHTYMWGHTEQSAMQAA